MATQSRKKLILPDDMIGLVIALPIGTGVGIAAGLCNP
jgi:hypothetical protein